MTLIWATRGRSWGFRFLHTGGLDDPLPSYEEAFSVVNGGDSAAFRRVGDQAVVRFPDPEGRKDRAGRLIPHDFVVYGQLVQQLHSVDDALRILWPQVADIYERVWELPKAPTAADLKA